MTETQQTAMAVAIPQVTVVHVSSSQLKNLNTAPVELVSAPGAGFAVCPVSICVAYKFAGAAYTNIDNAYIAYDGNVIFAVALGLDNLFLSASDQFQLLNLQTDVNNALNSVDLTGVENKDLYLADDTAWATGSGTAVIMVVYVIMPVS